MNKDMTELSIFAEATINQGGEWWLICEDGNVGLYQSKSKYMLGGQCNHYLNPVYQVFKNGNRIFASTNYYEALNEYRRELKQQGGE